jgi:hypothetical protein
MVQRMSRDKVKTIAWSLARIAQQSSCPETFDARQEPTTDVDGIRVRSR